MNIVGPRHGCARRAQLELAGFFHSGVLFLSRRSRATSRYRLPPATLTVFVTRYTSLFITRCMSSLHVFVRFYMKRVVSSRPTSKAKAVGCCPGRAISPSTRVVKKTSLDQMPAATPKRERLDEPPVKAIHSMKLNPTVPVRTPAPAPAAPCGPRAQHVPVPDIAPKLAVIAFQPPKPIHCHPCRLVQVLDGMPQSEVAGQEQLASEQQARRLGPL